MHRVAGRGAGQTELGETAGPASRDGPTRRLSQPCGVGTLQSGATAPATGAFTLNSASLGCLENPEALASWTQSCAVSLPAALPPPWPGDGALGSVFFCNNSKVESEALFIPVSFFRMEKGSLL